MKGATTEPCASTSKPPSISIIMMIGASHNFLRTRKLQQEMDNNPFAQTTNLISNISGGLGIWSGYNSTYYKVPIVKDTVIKDKYEPELFEIF